MARRTVAKYREQLNFPVARLRKSYKIKYQSDMNWVYLWSYASFSSNTFLKYRTNSCEKLRFHEPYQSVLDCVAMVHIDLEAKRTAQKMDHNALKLVAQTIP